MARGHPPPHCENTQVLREAITEDDDEDDDDEVTCITLSHINIHIPKFANCLKQF